MRSGVGPNVMWKRDTREEARIPRMRSKNNLVLGETEKAELRRRADGQLKVAGSAGK